MTVAPSAQEVADALALTLEREDAAGAPWCPPGDGAALRRWVTDRSASLGTGIRRAVRLVRLMAVADGRDYIRFLYERVSSLRGRQFRHALERAAAEGRLTKSVATLSENGVHLREAALAPQGAASDPFEIDFAQMPRLAALIDIMHNALGFAAVADLLAPLTKPGVPQRTADDIARALQSALNAWLGARLESANHLMQAQQIRAFLAGRGRLAPEAVDNEAILAFWTAAAEADDERMDGFRLYRSAAAALLRYAQALRDARVAQSLEQAVAGGAETANDDFPADQRETRTELWRSPLRALISGTGARVKWLTAKEQQALLNYLGGPAEEGAEPGEDGDAAGESGNEVAPWRAGLAGEERLDLAFWLTLLRADVFGAAQASIVGRLRKRADAESALAQAMAPLDAAAYTAEAYAGVREQLHVECLAALALLMEAGAAEAVILLDGLGGAAAVAAVVGAAGAAARTDAEEGEEDALRGALAPVLKAAIAEPAALQEGAGRALLMEAVAARRKVSRAGFRREDRTDAAMLAALRAGAAAVFGVMRELDRLIATLAQKAPGADIVADQARFQAAFRRIYLGAARAEDT